MRNFLLLITFSLIIIGCTSYQYIGVPIENAVNKGKVKSRNVNGDKFYWSKITKQDGQYYALDRSLNIPSDTTIPVDTTLFKEFQVKKKIYRIWLRSLNNEKDTGLLYQVEKKFIF